jgi:hypothetical protein
MAKQHFGKKIPRKKLQLIASVAMKKAEDRKLVNQNMLMYNAGLHLKLQHELCVCSHGASKHFGAPVEVLEKDGDGQAIGSQMVSNLCTVVDCGGCRGYKSNYSASFDKWIKEFRQLMDQKHGLPLLDSMMPTEKDQIDAFEGGVKPEAFAEAYAEQLTKPKDEVTAPAGASPEEKPQ